MPRVRFIPLVVTAIMLLLFTASGCGDDDGSKPFDIDDEDGGDGEGTICLLNNCDIDRDCQDCSKDRKVCSKKERRCIACGPDANGKTCKPGQYCTKYGDCVGSGVTCPEDEAGIPTITCKNNADCGACSPSFRVCDTASNKCVGCLPTDVSNCQSTDVCKDTKCVAKCPKDCAQDADCGECGAPGKEAHVCNRHICAQCSPTVPCPNGGACDLDHGTCTPPCGLGRPGKSNCKEDSNCEGCEGTTKCKLPVGGGEGVCAAPATGCSDIGKGIIVLPDPFSRVTQTCSGDQDCANVSADFNVGKILRDVTGINAIKDGGFSYAMHACASVEVLDKSCGVCVPCKQDTDCQDIDITKVAGDMFGPLGSVGAAILLDKAFGPNDRKIHMYCQNIAGDYGACLPCSNILSRCAVGGDVPAEGPCDHEVCETGGPLGIQCTDPCIAEVCKKDSYCCTKEWDFQCKTDVDLYCSKKTCEPDKCIYREEGWYCRSDPAAGGYRCSGERGNPATAEGRQCATGQYCHKTGDGPKDPAILCQSEGEDGCGPGFVGKPKCFDNPQ